MARVCVLSLAGSVGGCDTEINPTANNPLDDAFHATADRSIPTIHAKRRSLRKYREGGSGPQSAGSASSASPDGSTRP